MNGCDAHGDAKAKAVSADHFKNDSVEGTPARCTLRKPHAMFSQLDRAAFRAVGQELRISGRRLLFPSLAAPVTVRRSINRIAPRTLPRSEMRWHQGIWTRRALRSLHLTRPSATTALRLVRFRRDRPHRFPRTRLRPQLQVPRRFRPGRLGRRHPLLRQQQHLLRSQSMWEERLRRMAALKSSSTCRNKSISEIRTARPAISRSTSITKTMAASPFRSTSIVEVPTISWC